MDADDIAIYLVDYEQTLLVPLADGGDRTPRMDGRPVRLLAYPIPKDPVKGPWMMSWPWSLKAEKSPAAMVGAFNEKLSEPKAKPSRKTA